MATSCKRYITARRRIPRSDAGSQQAPGTNRADIVKAIAQCVFPLSIDNPSDNRDITEGLHSQRSAIASTAQTARFFCAHA